MPGLEPYEHEFLARLRAIDSTVLTPVLLRLFGEYDSRRRRPALAAIESYLLRRHLCGMAPRSHGDLVGPLLKELVRAADPGTVVRDHLAARTGKSTWPSNDAVRNQARVRPIYVPGRGNGAVHLMLMLAEGRLHGDAAPVLPAEKLTIEHLLPQSWREEGWPIDESTPRTMAREQIDRATLMHTLGNLTLVTFEENQRLADRPWADKIALLPSSPLRLNQRLPATFGSAASIRGRGEFLADLICAALPGPESAPVAVPKQRTSVAEPAVVPDPLVGSDDIDVEAERADEPDPSDASEHALDTDEVEEVTGGPPPRVRRADPRGAARRRWTTDLCGDSNEGRGRQARGCGAGKLGEVPTGDMGGQRRTYDHKGRSASRDIEAPTPPTRARPLVILSCPSPSPR